MADLDDEDELDNSNVSLQDVVKATHNKLLLDGCGHIAPREYGRLETATEAGKINSELKPLEERGEATGVREEGRGKRKRTVNHLYSLVDFVRHWDNEASDEE
jgi:hypothetical protein